MQAGMGSCGGSEDTNGDGFMGMMQGMMQNLLSKDLLYPSLKEIEEKVHFVFYLVICVTLLYTSNYDTSRYSNWHFGYPRRL